MGIADAFCRNRSMVGIQQFVGLPVQRPNRRDDRVVKIRRQEVVAGEVPIQDSPKLML